MSQRTSLPTGNGAVGVAELSKLRETENTSVLKNTFGADGPPVTTKFSVPEGLVKGSRRPGDKPVEDYDAISAKQRAVEKTYLASVHKSITDPIGAIGGLSPMFGSPLRMMMESSPWYQMGKWASSIDKSFTTTSPLGSGIVPFDLAAPTMLIYPVYTPWRNRFPRTQGQGLTHRAKVMTSIQGSQPSQFGNPSLRTSIPELPAGGNLTVWPNQLPPAGSQSVVDVSIPYRFFGLTEAVSWLAQFAGQGFDDIAALASLVLLQEFMLAEERELISATQLALTAPATAPNLTARAAVSGETALSGDTNGGIYVRITALNFYGETVSSAAGYVTGISAGEVVDVTLPAPTGGVLAQNIYVGGGTTDPGVSGCHLMATTGSILYTLQGAIPTGTATPPTADTGTNAATDYEGVFSILSGHAQSNPSTTGYPTGYEGGFIEEAVAGILSVQVIDNALRQVYNGSTSSYFADPSEIWTSAVDAKNLSEDLVVNGNDLNYTIFVQQDQVANVIAGMAVSQFTNPVTRSTVRITVHPYFPQGSAAGLSYTMPQVQTNVSNIWEVVNVQDYLSINWPVIDVTFRYSLFLYGTLFSPAPQYNFLLQGLQQSASKPYS